MTGSEMWQRFCRESGVDPNTPYEAWKFCGGGPAANELASLVLAGTKTASAKIAYDTEGEPLPEAGGYSVILFDSGEAACVIQDTKLSIVPFHAVSPEHAWKEGENDRSLENWREVHRRAFTPDYAAAGLEFDENGLCVLEEFRVVYK